MGEHYKKYVTVFFEDDSTYDVVRNTWFVTSNSLHYPPSKSYNTAMKTGQYESKWPEYVVEILGQADTFSHALNQCKRARSKGTCSTTDADEPRQRFEPQRFITESNVVGDGQQQQQVKKVRKKSSFPTAPVAPAPPLSSTFTSPSSSRDYSAAAAVPLPPASPILQENRSQVQKRRRQESPEVDESEGVEQQSSMKSTLPPSTTNQPCHCAHLEELMRQLYYRMGKLVMEVKELKQAVNSGGGLGQESRQASGVSELTSALPFEDKEHFHRWIGEVDSNPQKRASLVRYYRLLGGNNVNSLVSNIIQSTLTDRVLSSFSLHGRKRKQAQKDAFIASPLYKIVRDAVWRAFGAKSDATVDMINKACENYIKHASTRLRRTSSAISTAPAPAPGISEQAEEESVPPNDSSDDESGHEEW